mgnify:FL=1
MVYLHSDSHSHGLNVMVDTKMVTFSDSRPPKRWFLTVYNRYLVVFPVEIAMFYQNDGF